MNYADYYRAPLGPKKPSNYQNQYTNFRIDPQTLARYQNAYGSSAPAGSVMERYLQNNPNAMQGVGLGFGMNRGIRQPYNMQSQAFTPRVTYPMTQPKTPTPQWQYGSASGGTPVQGATGYRVPTAPTDPNADYLRRLQEWQNGGRVGQPPRSPIVTY